MTDLPRQMQMMQTFLNTKSQHQNPQIVWSRFSNFLQLLTITNSYVALEVTLKSITCAMCPNKATEKNEIISLTCCQATVCGKECFRKFVHQATKGSLQNIESVICPRCQNYLGRQSFSYFSEWEIITCNQRALQGNKPIPKGVTTFMCEIHYDDTDEGDAVKLTCAHKVCKDCVQGHIEAKIEEGKADITCPIKECPAQITDFHVRALVPKQYAFYLKLSMQGSKGGLASETESLFECPSADCPNIVIAPKNLFTYTCNMCQNTYCPQCKTVVHPNMTCQQYFEQKQAEMRLKQQNAADEQSTEDFFRNQPGNQYRQCPKCAVWIERINGCKFMSCQSQSCQGKTYFCITCGLQLETDHGAHKCTTTGYDYLTK